MVEQRATVEIEAVILALYRTLLLRDPDHGGLEAYVTAIASGAMTVEGAVSAFLQSGEFRRVAPKLLKADVLFDRAPAMLDHSQFGEVSLLMRHWVNEAAKHRIVVDVGARGKDRSNSYDLLRQLDWRGVLIEANPALLQGIRTDFDGLNFELLNVAVSDYEGQATFHIGINDDVSSLDADMSASWGEIQGYAQVNVRRLPSLLHEYNIPTDFDLLSLDIEGHDLKVLNDVVLDGRFKPKWIIIEASYEYKTSSLDNLDLSEEVGILYRIQAQTQANLILRRND